MESLGFPESFDFTGSDTDLTPIRNHRNLFQAKQSKKCDDLVQLRFLISEYSGRNLTHEANALDAFRGVLRDMQRSRP
jgi:hypothetical protein